MEDKYTIGLDYGTLSGRGVLVRCRDGEVIFSAEKEYTHGVMDNYLPDKKTILPSEWCLEHPNDYLEVLEYVIIKLLKNSGINKEDIIGIGVDFTASTVLPIDAKGVPLCMKEEFAGRRNAYVKLWKHHSAQKQADHINTLLKELGQEDNPRFGGTVSPELMVPKVLEMVQEDPQVYDSASEILEAGDWITRVLTGSPGRSCSMAGYKAWWNQREGYPDRDFFATVNPRMESFAEEKLPGKICSVGEAVGTLSYEWAERLGLKEGIPVAPAIIDSHAGVPGSGVSHEGQAMLVLGTSSVMLALNDKPYSQKGVYGGVRDGVVPGYYALESGLAAVGDLFAWFVDNLVPVSCYKEAAEQGADIYTLLNSKAEKLKAGESGLLVLDWWNGNKTPFVNGNLTGSITGLTLNTKPEQIYQALIEATAFGTRQILELYQEGGVRIEEIIASGGIASKNPMLMQIYADVLGVDMKIAASDQAAALGSAIYAALAAGLKRGGYDSYQEAVENMSRVKEKVYLFDADSKKKYDKLYQIYRNYSTVMGQKEKGILKGLHAIKNE